MQQRLIPGIVLLVVTAVATTQPAMAQAKFEKGDHIVFIGNGLPDRMQHHGWLEAYLQMALPKLQLVIRNQGFTGDKIDHRPRNRGFLNSDAYLTLSGADVIFVAVGHSGYAELLEQLPELAPGAWVVDLWNVGGGGRIVYQVGAPGAP